VGAWLRRAAEGVKRPELAMKESWRAQWEWSALRRACWTAGAEAASGWLQGERAVAVRSWKRGGESAYMQMRLFLALPGNGN